MTIDRYLRSFQLLLSPKLTTTVWFIPYRLLHSGKHHHTHHHASVVLKSCRGIWACLRLAQTGAPANVQLFGCIGAVCSIAAITTGVVYRSSLKSYPGRSARKWVDVGVAISPQGFFADGKMCYLPGLLILSPAIASPIDMIRSGFISCLVSTSLPLQLRRNWSKGRVTSCQPPPPANATR